MRLLNTSDPISVLNGEMAGRIKLRVVVLQESICSEIDDYLETAREMMEDGWKSWAGG